MVQILRRDLASLSPWWTVSWNFTESGVRRVEWKEGETSPPQISTLYQRKEKHCCRQYQRVPTAPTSWTGSKCSPLLKAAVGHQTLEGIIHSEFCVYGTPLELCNAERSLVISLHTSCLTSLSRYNRYWGTVVIFSIFLLKTQVDLSAYHDVGRILVYDSSYLAYSSLSPKERRPSPSEVCPT